MSKHHVTAKAQKRHRRNRQKVGRRLALAIEVVKEEGMSAEEVRVRAVGKAKEAGDANKLS